MVGIGAFIAGGALQGLGVGMMEGERQKAEERKQRALLSVKENKLYTVGQGEKLVDPSSGRVVAEGAPKAPDMPGIADELRAAGYVPGTPEYQTALVEVINGKYGRDYVDDKGNVRRSSPLNLTPPPSTQATQSGTGASEPVQVTSVEDARKLPPGTEFIDPNGVRRVVPGGPTQSASGGFRNIPSGNPLDPYP